MGRWGDREMGRFPVVCQGSVVRVGRRPKVGGIIVPVSFWEVSAQIGLSS